MRQYLMLSVVVSMALVLVVAGCASVDRAALNRSLYVDQHPELTELQAEAILAGQIMVGMNQDMVQTAWGKPVRVQAVDLEDVDTQWVYGNYFVGGNITSLYFDPAGTLVRYEVNYQPPHANAGTVSTQGEDTRGLLTRGDDVLLSKESGQP